MPKDDKEPQHKEPKTYYQRCGPFGFGTKKASDVGVCGSSTYLDNGVCVLGDTESEANTKSHYKTSCRFFGFISSPAKNVGKCGNGTAMNPSGECVPDKPYEDY